MRRKKWKKGETEHCSNKKSENKRDELDSSGKNEHSLNNEEVRQGPKEDGRFTKQIELTFVLVVFKSLSYY